MKTFFGHDVVWYAKYSLVREEVKGIVYHNLQLQLLIHETQPQRRSKRERRNNGDNHLLTIEFHAQSDLESNSKRSAFSRSE